MLIDENDSSHSEEVDTGHMSHTKEQENKSYVCK